MTAPLTGMTEETHFKKTLDLKLLQRFFRYGLAHKKWLFLALISVPLTTVIQTVQPMIVQVVVDQHMVPRVAQGMAFWLWLFASLVAVQFVLGYLQALINVRLGQGIVNDIRRDLFGKMLALDAGYHTRNASGTLTNRLTNDTELLTQMVSAGLIHLLTDIILLIGIFAGMLLLSPTLSLVAVVTIPVLVAGTLFIARRLRHVQRRARVLQARMSGFLTEVIEGRDVVRLFNRQQANLDHFNTLNREHHDCSLKSTMLEAGQFSFVEGVSTIAIALLLGLGGFLIAESLQGAPASGVSLGVLVAFIDYLRRVFQPIRDLSSKFTTMQAAMSALERIFEVMDTTPAVEDASHPDSNKKLVSSVEKAPPTIRFEKVGFHYDKESPVLTDLSLTIHGGSKVAIVGPTGSGKSTLIRLLNRSWETTIGEIRIDGVNHRQIPLNVLRSRIGIVAQETFLFAETLRNNITLFDPSLETDRIEQVVDHIGLSDVVKRLPDGLDTVLGERGSPLSSGQKQLLALARFMVQDPEIMVLDEATSSVDAVSERRIQSALEQLLENRTAVIIAHRLSTIRGADTIAVLKGGCVAESGCHDELMAKPDGLYAAMQSLDLFQAGE
ncbi:MAG: ABC transporter ATP-binding protein [Magnetococcales bacterium]|nr:ABC transporter ATP-binding protein [Magnetococcales bacterium]